MTVVELIAGLAKRGCYLRATADDGIEFVGPRAHLTRAVRAFIRDHKDDVLEWLRTPACELPAEDLRLLDYSPDLEIVEGPE